MVLPILILAAIAACEIRTLGMGLQRSDGRNAGIADGALLPAFMYVDLAMLTTAMMALVASSLPVLACRKSD